MISIDRATRLVNIVVEDEKYAKMDLAEKQSTADRHPCPDCDAMVRNARVRLHTLQEVLDMAGIQRS